MNKHPFPESHAARVRPLWTLDPEVTFLNHGSFGACPRVVLDAQAALRERMEKEPVRFFLRELEALADEARKTLATFLGADAEEIVAVPNATAGVNTVLRSLDLKPGDRLLTTSHEYNACRNALEFVAKRVGAHVTVVDIPFPIKSPEEAFLAVRAAAGPRTRLLLIDHVTSQTGLVLPVKRIVDACSKLGIDTLVDGAHAPAMVPLDLRELGAAYYTGNCHKWLCAPKGAAFLYVRRDKQADIRPLCISHGANSTRRDRSRFRLEFDWTGTDDPTAFLCIPEALRFLEGLLPGGIPALAVHNQRTALAAREVLCEALGIAPPAPEEMIGSLAAIPLPDALGSTSEGPLQIDPLQDELFLRHRIEVPIIPFPKPPQRLLRISAQIYNAPEEYLALAKALRSSLRISGRGTAPESGALL